MTQMAFPFAEPITFTPEEQQKLIERIAKHKPPTLYFAPGCRITRRMYHHIAMMLIAAADRKFTRDCGISTVEGN